MRRFIVACALALGLFGAASVAAPNVLAAPAAATHSVTLFGPVSCPAPYYSASQVRIQAFNGEAHDATLSLVGRWYAVTFTHVPSGGEGAYVYVSCGLIISGKPIGGMYGLKGPIHLNGFAGYQYLDIYKGE